MTTDTNNVLHSGVKTLHVQTVKQAKEKSECAVLLDVQQPTLKWRQRNENHIKQSVHNILVWKLSDGFDFSEFWLMFRWGWITGGLPKTRYLENSDLLTTRHRNLYLKQTNKQNNPLWIRKNCLQGFTKRGQTINNKSTKDGGQSDIWHHTFILWHRIHPTFNTSCVCPLLSCHLCRPKRHLCSRCVHDSK